MLLAPISRTRSCVSSWPTLHSNLVPRAISAFKMAGEPGNEVDFRFPWRLGKSGFFCTPPWGVLPYKGLMGKSGQSVYGFRGFCLLFWQMSLTGYGFGLSVSNRVSKIGRVLSKTGSGFEGPGRISPPKNILSTTPGSVLYYSLQWAFRHGVKTSLLACWVVRCFFFSPPSINEK